MSTPRRGPQPTPPSSFERTLSFMVAGVFGLAVLGIVAIFVTSALGAYDPSEQLGAFLTVLPPVGLAAGAVLFVVWMVVRGRRMRGHGAR